MLNEQQAAGGLRTHAVQLQQANRKGGGVHGR